MAYGQPYYMRNNPYGQQPYNQQFYNQQPYNYQMYQQPLYQQQQAQQQTPSILQGKAVDSIDVVKAMDIPLDGSITYFPLVDGTSIVTKQLQMDGSTKITVYKAVEEGEEEKNISTPKYLTSDDLNEALINLDTNGLDGIRKSIEELSQDIKEINKEIKKKKG